MAIRSRGRTGLFHEPERAALLPKSRESRHSAGDVRSPLGWKTSARRYAALEKFVRSIHSYDVPEIIALSVDQGLRPYLAWVHKETATN